MNCRIIVSEHHIIINALADYEELKNTIGKPAYQTEYMQAIYV